MTALSLFPCRFTVRVYVAVDTARRSARNIYSPELRTTRFREGKAGFLSRFDFLFFLYDTSNDLHSRFKNLRGAIFPLKNHFNMFNSLGEL